ncbi:dithiobiotin synthetase [Mycobacterium tuberculosis CAS/NITR204]|uniref:Dithiobiotin synthetase n=1 Tax=Mycobacterium tuberculosis CAS/NITR204 TaxID=1310114 RepID=R4MHX7_MYCTX|nr:dithiobiotin synthetase [Mycobacterium tuberculosis CAS/NITR204]
MFSPWRAVDDPGRHRDRHGGRQDGRGGAGVGRRQAGIDVAVCKPVQTGTARGDDDLAEVGRLAGVTQLAGLARYPQPMAPAAAAEHAGMALAARIRSCG